MTGSEMTLHCDTPAGRLVVTAARHALEGLGESVQVVPDMARAHVFAAETGARLP